MAFCSKCGAEVKDGTAFCPACGAGVEEAKEQQAKVEPISVAPNDAEDNKLMAILAYILFFIPLITGDHKKSPFVKFHTNQGTVLAIVAIAWSIIQQILKTILWSSYSWGIYGFISIIFSILSLAIGVLCILGIINAATGKTKELPLIGKFTIIK